MAEESHASNVESLPVKQEKRRRGRPRDQQGPQKPLTPRQQVTMAARLRLKSERPELATDFSAMSAELNAAWAAVPVEEKDSMQKKYEADMEAKVGRLPADSTFQRFL